MKSLAENRDLEQRLRSLIKAWRVRADQFADHHCDEVAVVYRLLSSEVDAALLAWDSEPLTIQAASGESGYSAEYLRRLTRAGKLTSERNAGTKTHLRVRRANLPGRAGGASESAAGPVSEYNPSEDARDIAKRLGGSNA